MRQVLVDHARTRLAARRGGAQTRVEFNDSLDYSDDKASGLVALDDALKGLAAFDERKARTLELRYFGGLRVEETAEVLGISVATVGRETRDAEAWLRRELQSAQAAQRGAKQIGNSSLAAARSESVVREFPGSAQAAQRGAKQISNSSAAAARSQSVVRRFPGSAQAAQRGANQISNSSAAAARSQSVVREFTGSSGRTDGTS